MLSRNQRTIHEHFPYAQIVGDGPYCLLSDCSLFQVAYLFRDSLLRDAKMLRCGDNCKGMNRHTVRNISQPKIIQPTTPFRVPGDWCA